MEVVLDRADSKILGNQLNFMVHQNFLALRIWRKYLKGT